MRRMGKSHNLSGGSGGIQEPGDGMKHVSHSQFLTHFQKPVDRRMVQTDIQIGEAFLVDQILYLLHRQNNGITQPFHYNGSSLPSMNAVIFIYQRYGTD